MQQQEPTAPRQPATPGFVADLAARGDRVAVIEPGGVEVTYRDLDERVTDAAHAIGAGRRLVLLASRNDLASVVGYLAALRGGHPLLLVPASDERQVAALVAAYDPDVVLSGGQVQRRRAGSAHELHPDLAMLLSTSGSTGSPKLVRLSAAGVDANAAAIAEYLGIRDTDRAALSLPLHYCYGLSVLNSNLQRGAAVLLLDCSVTEPRHWDAVRTHGATSLHGVPYTFELLDRVGFAEMVTSGRLPSLRYLTQAGGRMAPADVRRYAALGERAGWELFVMYGQTEATARMAYLPPRLAAAHPAAVGVPIPGGSFELRDCVDGVGELVYRGPNVMLGYAERPADLALGRTVDALPTGDLARRGPGGLIEITGRSSRIVKPFGLRVDLDRVERLLADEGCIAACGGDDSGLVVAVIPGHDADRVRDGVADLVGLPAGRISVCELAEFPRLASGKIDYSELRPPASGPDPRLRCGSRPVLAAFHRVFPLQRLDEGATFVGLGGDSLSYVQMTMELERVLGHTPAGWPMAPIRELEARTPRRRAWTALETPVVLRALAIVLVVGSHVGLFTVLGGAHLLLAVGGWMFARFVLENETDGAPAPSRRILRSLCRMAIPTLLWVCYRAAVDADIEWHNVLLLNQFLDPSAWGYWYVEVMIQALLLLAAVFSVPTVRRLHRRFPFGFALGVLAVALAARGFTDPGNEFSDRLMGIHLVLWLFVLGWVARAASSPGRRIAVAGLVLLLVPGFFADPVRDGIVAGGLLALLVVSHLPVPRSLAAPIGHIAAASLYIYLTHYAVFPALLPVLPPWAVVLGCLAAGILTWSIVERWAPRWAGRLAAARHPSGVREPTVLRGVPRPGRPVRAPAVRSRPERALARPP